MDADKDKSVSEKSPPEDAKIDKQADDKDSINNNNNNDSNNSNNNEQPPEKPNVYQDLPQNHVANSPSAPKPPSDADQPNPEPPLDVDHNPEPPSNVDPNAEKVDEPDSETKNEDELAEPEVEESPPLSRDLNKVSEEIDQYISTLSTSKGDESTPPEVSVFVEQFAILVEAKIADYDSSDSPVKWSRLTEEDSASFLECTMRLISLSKALLQFSSDDKFASPINRIGGVLQRAISYIEEEFKSLLEDYKIHDSDPKQSTSPTSNNQESEETPPPEPAAPAEENNFPGYSDEIVSELIRLSKTMFACGHEMECCEAYFVARRNALEESLQKLGFEKYSIDDVQKMQWESLEREIIAWIRTLKQCIAVHFPGERKLSNAVFSDKPSVSESLFCGLSHGVTIQLLNFAEAVALTKRAAEKLFKFLDVYESLRDTLPILDDLFPDEKMNEIRTEATVIKGRLGEAMIAIFVELESSIQADSSKTPVPGGAVHPLTRYTMNYLKYACEYKETLDQVFREHQKIERADSTSGSDFNYNSQAQNVNEAEKQSPFQTQMVKVMDLLDQNLEGKSKLYKDHSLSSIFMMNNGRYILQKIRGSDEFNRLMGDPWYRRRSSELRQYHKGYQRETWGKLLNCFHPEGLIVNGKVVKPVLKERFKSFNQMFDEIHKTQSTWVVSDEQLQSELRVSISNMVIPAYRSFLGRFSQVFTPGRQTEKYVKYQAEDIETYIDELFDGNAAPMGRKKP